MGRLVGEVPFVWYDTSGRGRASPNVQRALVTLRQEALRYGRPLRFVPLTDRPLPLTEKGALRPLVEKRVHEMSWLTGNARLVLVLLEEPGVCQGWHGRYCVCSRDTSHLVLAREILGLFGAGPTATGDSLAFAVGWTSW